MKYCNWFNSVINFFVNLFFLMAIMVTLYVFTSSFKLSLRIILFVSCLIIYLLLVYYLKDKIKALINKVILKVDSLTEKQCLLIISITMLVLRIIVFYFFNFDATTKGDVGIYNDIAEEIISKGKLGSNAISHLYGVALHYVLFKLCHLPVSEGTFVVLYIGTIANFFSFKDIIGKNKAFLVLMFYIIMPSTAFLSFCPTHEVFLYMYLSLFFLIVHKIIKEKNLIKNSILILLAALNSALACLVNPSGYLTWIIMALMALFAKMTNQKKIMIVLITILAIIFSVLFSKILNVNEHITTMNTYTILIHGSNPQSLGEQVDGYPLRQMRAYIYANSNDFSDEGFVQAAKSVLFGQYRYLLSHPLVLIKLIIHKFYILYSGVHYPLELANYYGAIDGIFYYALLVTNTLLYFFMLSIGMFLNKKKADNLSISNYKLILLGNLGVTMFCVVLNKYSLYVTVFIYLLAFYRMGDNYE